jgi:hypothetical protein
MKVVLIAMLLASSVASADEYAGPPGGYPLPPAGVLVPVAPMPVQVPMPVQAPMPMRPRGELRAAILARFDRNGDGRLEPNERRHAIRALRRLARRLAREGGPGPARRQRRDFE